jgi:peroxiredoxin
MNTLAQQIEAFNLQAASQLPKEVLDSFGQSIIDLKQKNIESHSAAVGHHFPEFSLPNVDQKNIHSKDILKNGKMVVAFYRGSWCPYCNLELKALQNILPILHTQGATLVAISPQSVTHSASLKQQHDLGYELLSDHNNLLAKQLGIVFKLQDFVLPSYAQIGIDLSAFNQNQDHELPMPAVFVVGQDSIISYRFVDANYTNRIELDQLIAAL